jgi:hypothetical protein
VRVKSEAMKSIKPIERLITIFAIFLLVNSCTSSSEISSGNVIQIGSGIFSRASWSQDGSSIIAIGQRILPAGVAHLYIIDIASAKANKVTEVAKDYKFAAWSPDGMKIALTIDQSSIWILDREVGTTSYLTNGKGAVWLPDGKRLAVYTGVDNPMVSTERKVEIVDLSGKVVSTILVDPFAIANGQPTEGSSEHLTGISISPDGREVILNLTIFLDIYNQGGVEHKSYLINIADGGYDPIFIDEPIIDVSWSHSNSTVAFIEEEGYFDGKLIIEELATGCRIVSPFPPYSRSPSWSSEDLKVMFLYKGQIHIWDIESSLRDGTVVRSCR